MIIIHVSSPSLSFLYYPLFKLSRNESGRGVFPHPPNTTFGKKKKLVKKSNCILFFGFWHQKGLSLQQKKRRSVFKFLIHENNYIENTYVYFSFNNDREKKMQNKDWDDNTKIMAVSSSSIFFQPLQHLFPFQHALTWLAFSHWRRS